MLFFAEKSAMLPLVAPLPLVEAYAACYRPVMSDEEHSRLCRYVSGLLISENKTVEGINRLFVLDVEHQSTLNRFLTASKFDVPELNWARVKWLQDCPQTAFKHGEGGKGALVLDDTLLAHYGPHFEKAAWLYDHVTKAHTWAHNLVNLHYSDDQTDYPVDFRFWEPADLGAVESALLKMGCTFQEKYLNLKKEAPAKWQSYLLKRYGRKRAEPLKGTTLEVAHKTKIDYARDLLDGFFAAYPGADLPVAFDPWYTCTELCAHIDKVLKKAYVGTLCNHDVLLIGAGKKEARCDEFVKELVKQHQEALKNGKKPLFEKVGISYKGQKETYYAYCQNHHTRNFGRQRIVVSFSKEDLSDSEPKFYMSNRLHWRCSGILRIRRHRWPIEVYHEEAKAEGLDQYELRQFDAVKKHVACVCAAYSMLKRVQFDPEFLNTLQWNPAKKTGSLAFWRRVMTANALIALIQWIVQELPDKEKFAGAVRQLVKAYN